MSEAFKSKNAWSALAAPEGEDEESEEEAAPAKPAAAPVAAATKPAGPRAVPTDPHAVGEADLVAGAGSAKVCATAEDVDAAARKIINVRQGGRALAAAQSAGGRARGAQVDGCVSLGYVGAEAE
jgi:hypothetical protein